MSLLKRLSFLLIVTAVFSQNYIVDNMKQCIAKDKTKLDDCIKQTFEVDLFKLVTMGDKRLNVQPMEPLKIDPFVYNQEGAALKATATFSNVQFTGLSKATFHLIRYDKPSQTVYFNITASVAGGSANYDMKGSILLIPVDGKGVVTFNITDPISSIVVQFQPQGATAKLASLKFDLDGRDVNIHFDGLASGDAVGEAVSKVISDNSRLMFEDIRPLLMKELENAMFRILKDHIFLPTEILNA